jgi:hypothetical protein
MMNWLSPTATDNIAESVTLRVVKFDKRSQKVSNNRRFMWLTFRGRNGVDQKTSGFAHDIRSTRRSVAGRFLPRKSFMRQLN